MSPEDRAMFRLPEDALGAIHFRAIERIYGDSVRVALFVLCSSCAEAVFVLRRTRAAVCRLGAQRLECSDASTSLQCPATVMLVLLTTNVLCRAVGVCAAPSKQGAQLIELLRKNPAVAIPVIIIRLEQKEAEWLKVGGTGPDRQVAAVSTCVMVGRRHRRSWAWAPVTVAVGTRAGCAWVLRCTCCCC